VVFFGIIGWMEKARTRIVRMRTVTWNNGITA
jgi:hypothetical protein